MSHSVSPEPPAPSQPKPKKPLWKRWWFIALAVIVVIWVIAIATGGGEDAAEDEVDPSPTVTESANAETSPNAEPTDTEPAGEDQEPADDSADTDLGHPEFDAIEQTGTGDSVIALPDGATAGVVTASHEGTANFSISALDAGNEPTGDLLVNTIGTYSGVTAFGLSSFGDATSLAVTADGAWTVRVEPISAAPIISLPASGTGPAVYLYDGGAATWAVVLGGDGHVALATYGEGLFSADLLVNDIGPYEGTVAVKAGPAVVTITTDGDWSITPQ